MQAIAFAFLTFFASHPAEPVPRNWIELKAGQAFTIKAPPGTKFQPEQGIDSFVGSFVGRGFKIHFDYGIYSNDLEGMRGKKGIAFTDTQIDEKKGVIVIARPNTPGCRTEVASHIKTAHVKRFSFLGRGYPKSLTIYGCANIEDNVQIMKSMYRSIHFID